MPSGDAAEVLRKWYFCGNEAAISGSRARLLTAAVRSCLERTELRPHMIYDGPRHPTLRALRDMGVTVIRHAPLLAPSLRHGYGDRYETFRGHWLRIDIPHVETEDATVLYTDIDVLFRSMPAALRRPETIAVAPERWRFRWRAFNSGVMLMNLPGLRAVDDALREAVRRRLHDGFRYPPHDQASLQAFFGDRADRLPLSMNWKPYWGVNDAAHIVHFHGPTPDVARAVARKGQGGATDAQVALLALDPRAYDAFAAEYDRVRAARGPTVRAAGVGSTRIVDAPPPGRAARLAQDAGGRAREAWRSLRRGDLRGARVPLKRDPAPPRF